MLNICFTADHELFSGHNFAAEEEIVIIPTHQLMTVLERYNIPLCLMTDVWSIIRYKELNVDSPYPAMMDQQLCDAISRGHDVQLHIHPHWVTSKYVNRQWEFDYSKFRLHHFGFSEDAVYDGRRIIAEGKRYLINLLKPIDENYGCIAFRAGGWCLQPEKEYLQALSSEGIMIDTSVYFGGYQKDEISYFDFRRVPSSPNWWIDPQKGLEFESDQAAGHIYEVAIGSYYFKPMLGLKKLILKPCRISSKSKKNQLKGVSFHSFLKRKKAHRAVEKIKQFLFQPIIFSYDSACAKVMMSVVREYLKRFDCRNQEFYISLIGHPKVLTEESIREIEKFCLIISERYSEVVRFIRFRDMRFY